MVQIGTAKICIDKLQEFIHMETEHAKKKEPGWYVNTRQHIPDKIEKYVWYFYRKCGEGRTFPIAEPDPGVIKEIYRHQEYVNSVGLSWELIYYSDPVCAIRSGTLIVGLPTAVLEISMYADLDDYSVDELRSKISQNSPFAVVSGTGTISKTQVKNKMKAAQDEIEAKESEIRNIEKEKKDELEKIRLEIEKKYKDKLMEIETQKAEMENQMRILEGQMFLLDTEIYSIRCFMGETVQFIPLIIGRHSTKTEPLVFYQKVRYLDEEMGKWLAIYGFDGSDFRLFEEALKVREDIRDIFAPGPKSISLIKVSKNNVQYCDNEYVANALKEYESYHGKTIGILLRDGENLWIGWTDEDRIRINDDNAFYKPEVREEDPDDPRVATSSKEETASRYFIFSILQGVINHGDFVHLPEGINILKPSPYIIFSMADGWLEDNRFGTFSEIVERTSAPLTVGDMIMTTMRITRDDDKSFYSGKDTRYEAWNNGDRGRGEKNRTHDAYIPDRKVLPVNCIDFIQIYTACFKKYKLNVREVVDQKYVENGIDYTRSHPETTRTEEYLGVYKSTIEVINGKFYGKYGNTKGMDPEQVYQSAKSFGYFERNAEDYISTQDDYAGSFYLVYDHTELLETESRCYISAKKTDSNFWGDKKDSYANMEIRETEYLNLTFLNSIYLVYAIQNRKLGGWRRGNKVVDYADSIPYLNTALQFIRGREEKEAQMLSQYMELYDGWQVDVSEWRLKHGYHRLTDTRAKKFAKEHQ